jgi:hypothetical protein
MSPANYLLEEPSLNLEEAFFIGGSGEYIKSIKDLKSYIQNKKASISIVEVTAIKKFLEKRVNELTDDDIFMLIDLSVSPSKSDNSRSPLLLSTLINIKLLADRFGAISAPFTSTLANNAFKVVHKFDPKHEPEHELLLELLLDALNHRLSNSKLETYSLDVISEGFSCLKCFLEPTTAVLRLIRLLGEMIKNSKDRDDLKCKNFMMVI